MGYLPRNSYYIRGADKGYVGIKLPEQNASLSELQLLSTCD